jgi:hypothetical protein
VPRPGLIRFQQDFKSKLARQGSDRLHQIGKRVELRRPLEGYIGEFDIQPARCNRFLACDL